MLLFDGEGGGDDAMSLSEAETNEDVSINSTRSFLPYLRCSPHLDRQTHSPP
jgi:hypothetical protein